MCKEVLDLCMMKWRDWMEFLLESHDTEELREQKSKGASKNTVEKSYRLAYGAKNLHHQCARVKKKYFIYGKWTRVHEKKLSLDIGKCLFFPGGAVTSSKVKLLRKNA